MPLYIPQYLQEVSDSSLYFHCCVLIILRAPDIQLDKVIHGQHKPSVQCISPLQTVGGSATCVIFYMKRTV